MKRKLVKVSTAIIVILSCLILGFVSGILLKEYVLNTIDKVKNIEWKKEPVEKRIVKNENNKDNTLNLIFTKEDGTYVGTDITRYPFEIIHKELGIKKCRFYDLRGSYATKILTNGVEIRDVADILGHRNIETTENYYISSTEDSRKYANEAFEKTTQSSVIDEIIEYEI